jgi:heme-degrading monooxygenase HmoA
MPYVMVSNAQSREQYEGVAKALRLDEERPQGLLLHAASETNGGSVEIVDVWESQEAMTAFQNDRLFPTFEAAGLGELVTAEDQPVAYEPFHFLG